MKYDRNLAKNLQILRIKWNFELTVFELSVPDLYEEIFPSHNLEILQPSTILFVNVSLLTEDVGDSDTVKF